MIFLSQNNILWKLDNSILSGSGLYLTLRNGKKVFDTVSGMWCANWGYNVEELNKAALNTYNELSFCCAFGKNHGYANELCECLKKKVNNIGYSPKYLHLSVSGSGLVDDVLKLLIYMYRNYGNSRRCKILSFRNAYHGATYLAQSINGLKNSRNNFPPFSIVNINLRFPSRNYIEDDEALEAWLSYFEQEIVYEDPESFICCILEPVQGIGGGLHLPINIMKRVHSILKKYEIPFIGDEISTGIGRCGYLSVFLEYYKIQPDIILFGKALTGGYFPLTSAILFDQADIIKNLENMNYNLPFGYTFAAHPVGCEIAKTVLDLLLTEELMKKVREFGTYFEKYINSIGGSSRGMGLFQFVDLVNNVDETELHKELLEKGFYVLTEENGYIPFVPPLTFLSYELKEEIFKKYIESCLPYLKINEKRTAD